MSVKLISLIILVFLSSIAVSFSIESITDTIPQAHVSYGTKIANYNYVKQKKFYVLNDTLKATNKIYSLIQEKSGLITIKISLKNYNTNIKLLCYNMLGKKVKTIHDAPAKPKDFEYTYDASRLPNGVFVIVLYGQGFRNAKKFIISR